MWHYAGFVSALILMNFCLFLVYVSLFLFQPARQLRHHPNWVPALSHGAPRTPQRSLGSTFSRPSPCQASQQRNSNKPKHLPKPNPPPNFTKANQTASPNSAQPNTGPKQDSFAKAFNITQRNGNEGQQHTKPVKTGQFYNDGVRQLPRATRFNQEKQFAPYYEVSILFLYMDFIT